jgi:enamine deaminase RidA (YjgF/YER057c/UK114 family)
LAGVQIQALRPAQTKGDVWTIYDHGISCGRGWKRNGAVYLLLQNIHGLGGQGSTKTAPTLQAERMLTRANEILSAEGATYRDVARTWIYLRNILAWYGPFNVVRNGQYARFGLLAAPTDSGRALPPPASTGIEGDFPSGAACVMDLLAVTGPPGRRPEITRLSNTKQKDAFSYGAAFSRGVCIREADVSLVQISGTAAIDEAGKSLYPDDVCAQIDRTLDNIEALMAQVKGKLSDMSSVTVFLKRSEDIPRYRQVAAQRGLADLPAVVVRADVCRAELLFELDAMAVVPHSA